MGHLRVELQAEAPRLGRLDGRDHPVLGAGRDGKALGETIEAIAVAHPDLLPGRQASHEARGPGDFQGGAAVLALGMRDDLAAAQVVEQLHPVADAEHRYVEREHAGGRTRSTRLVHARGAAREDDPLEAIEGDALDRGVVGQDGGVDAHLADAPRDERGVLATEI
ncbi:hypothetical protein D3C86_1728290 [compost metagenome]